MISILSDFGLEDTYVAAMKAVIYGIAPSTKIMDLTHVIPPGDVTRGALELWRIAPVLPPGTVILGVVDPGVGTPRRAIAIQTSRLICVGPDNGLFTHLLDEENSAGMVELTNPDYHLSQVSHTFHGRDIFAPAAAHLASGVPISELGPPMTSIRRLPAPALQSVEPGVLRGEILYADHFGNLVTSIGRLSQEGSNLKIKPWTGKLEAMKFQTQDPELVLPNGTRIPLTDAFGDVEDGTITAYIGSAGLLEVAVNGGSALERSGLQRGERVELRI